MKNRSIKKWMVIIALTAVCGACTGCGNARVKEAVRQAVEEAQNAQEHTGEQESSAVEEKNHEDAQEKDTEEGAAVQEAGKQETGLAETGTTTQGVTDMIADGTLSGDWTDMEFILDGKTYQLPFAYEELEAEGWTFDLADYGYPDGYPMEPGDKVSATIDLTNPAYDEDLTIRVGFQNFTDNTLDMKECAVWSLELDTCYGYNQVDSYPGMTIGNGLTIGSSRSEVEAVCGPCEDIYENTERGYATYSYNIDNEYLDITVFDEMGVTSFDLSTYTDEWEQAEAGEVAENNIASENNAVTAEAAVDTRGTESADAGVVAMDTTNVSLGSTLSGEWTDMQFILDGKNYQLPFAYAELEAEGWTFDLADYGYADGYVLNPGDKVYATINLTNPAYDKYLRLYVGFKNFTDKAKDIKECDVWSLELDTCHGFDQFETYPDMTIGNGLTIGSSRSEVEALCGPCEDIYENTERGYAVYSYDIDSFYLDITVYDTIGITSFDLSTYE